MEPFFLQASSCLGETRGLSRYGIADMICMCHAV